MFMAISLLFIFHCLGASPNRDFSSTAIYQGIKIDEFIFVFPFSTAEQFDSVLEIVVPVFQKLI